LVGSKALVLLDRDLWQLRKWISWYPKLNHYGSK
jgi:hypothetical protein